MYLSNVQLKRAVLKNELPERSVFVKFFYKQCNIQCIMTKGLNKNQYYELSIRSEKLSPFESISLPENLSLERKEGIRMASIIFVVEGRITVSYDVSEYHVVNKMEMFFLPPACPYSVKCIEDSQLITCIYRIDRPLCERYSLEELVDFCSDDDTPAYALKIHPSFTPFLYSIKTYLRDKIDCSFFYDLKKDELAHLFFIYYTKRDLALFFYPIIGEEMQFKELVWNNFLLVKSVPELAKIANYSTSGFIKKFQRYFNESPYRWIQRQKAKRILSDICEKEKPLKEIAMDYNFYSYQHFAEFCKVHFGVSPTRIKEKKVKYQPVKKWKKAKI